MQPSLFQDELVGLSGTIPPPRTAPRHSTPTLPPVEKTVFPDELPDFPEEEVDDARFSPEASRSRIPHTTFPDDDDFVPPPASRSLNDLRDMF